MGFITFGGYIFVSVGGEGGLKPPPPKPMPGYVPGVCTLTKEIGLYLHANLFSTMHEV